MKIEYEVKEVEEVEVVNKVVLQEEVTHEEVELM